MKTIDKLNRLEQLFSCAEDLITEIHPSELDFSTRVCYDRLKEEVSQIRANFIAYFTEEEIR